MPLFDGLTKKSTLTRPISDTPRDGVNSVASLPDYQAPDATGTNLARVYAEDELEQSKSEMELAAALTPLQTNIRQKYESARFSRKPVEQTWLSNMLQWRGEFSAAEQDAIARAKARNVYSSEVFIKITKTKVTAALGQILDLVLDNDEIPIRIEPAPHQGKNDLPQVGFLAPESFPLGDGPYGWAGDGKVVPKGATTKTIFEQARDSLAKLGKKFVSGGNPDSNKMPTVTPAMDAADRMNKIIISQLEEGGFKRELRYAAWEMCVLGTGLVKGPMTYETVEQNWIQGDPDPETGKAKIIYQPKIKQLPKLFYVSCWNFFPDPNATRIENCQWTIEKHLLNASALTDLKRIEGFDAKTIDRVILHGVHPRPREYWEQQIKDAATLNDDNRWEVLEYWGYLDKDMVNTYRMATGEDLVQGQDQFHVNVWMTITGEILRLVINPFVPERIPYYAIPYEEHTQQIWGIAIPENMRDAQVLMNGHYRMMVDNLALAGNCVFEVNENYLSPGQDLTVYPGKVFRTNNGAPGQSVFSLSFNNTSQSHLQAFQAAKQMADEVTGQPSYAYGGVSTTGANRTASGISMLMGAAAGNIRQVVKQCDEYLFHPVGQAVYNWNMQHNDEAVVEGKVQIIAGGTVALMRTEVLSQRLLQFAQAVGANPAIAPRVNWNQWLKDFAKSMKLDPDKYINDQNAMMLAAEMMAKAQGGGQGPQQQGSASQAGGAQDQTGGGGGQIAASSAPTPGESQSTQNLNTAA
jgi:hypothetical protein